VQSLSRKCLIATEFRNSVVRKFSSEHNSEQYSYFSVLVLHMDSTLLPHVLSAVAAAATLVVLIMGASVVALRRFLGIQQILTGQELVK
jgi:hypothetical protein